MRCGWAAGPRHDSGKSQCRLRDRQGGQGPGHRLDPAGRQTPCGDRGPCHGRDKCIRRDGLCDPRALRPHGRTPPCAEALVRAGLARVVTAIEDPDPRVSGAGHKILREAGIDVITGIGAEEARRDLAGFLTRIVKARPQVILKLAVSADARSRQASGRDRH